MRHPSAIADFIKRAAALLLITLLCVVLRGSTASTTVRRWM